MSGKSFRKTLLSKLLGATSNYKGSPISEVTLKKLLEATEVVEETKKMDVRIE